jgi:hypothetical protein
MKTNDNKCRKSPELVSEVTAAIAREAGPVGRAVIKLIDEMRAGCVSDDTVMRIGEAAGGRMDELRVLRDKMIRQAASVRRDKVVAEIDRIKRGIETVGGQLCRVFDKWKLASRELEELVRELRMEVDIMREDDMAPKVAALPCREGRSNRLHRQPPVQFLERTARILLEFIGDECGCRMSLPNVVVIDAEFGLAREKNRTNTLLTIRLIHSRPDSPTLAINRPCAMSKQHHHILSPYFAAHLLQCRH